MTQNHRHAQRSLSLSLILLSLGLLLVLALLFFSFMRPKSEALATANLVTLEGRAFSTDTLIGKPSVIHFFHKNCTRCLADIQLLERASQAANPRYQHVHYLFVYIENDPVFLQRYVQENALDVNKIYIDADNHFFSLSGLSSVPSQLFIDAKGKVISKSGALRGEARLSSDLKRITAN